MKVSIDDTIKIATTLSFFKNKWALISGLKSLPSVGKLRPLARRENVLRGQDQTLLSNWQDCDRRPDRVVWIGWIGGAELNGALKIAQFWQKLEEELADLGARLQVDCGRQCRIAGAADGFDSDLHFRILGRID